MSFGKNSRKTKIDFPVIGMYYLSMATTQTKENLNTLIKEKGLTMDELKELSKMVSDPWKEVRGILKHKNIDALKYQKKIRRELER